MNEQLLQRNKVLDIDTLIVVSIGCKLLRTQRCLLVKVLCQKNDAFHIDFVVLTDVSGNEIYNFYLGCLGSEANQLFVRVADIIGGIGSVTLPS